MSETYPTPSPERQFMEEWERRMETTVPVEQLERAQGMAAHYGHEWAGYEIDWNKDPSLGDIYKDTVSHRKPGQIAGISYPDLDDEGNIVHETLTGRTRWIVRPDGSARITISRPSGNVLTYDESGHGFELEVLGAFGERHLRALIEAVSGLGFSAGDTFFTCADLYDQIDESV